MSKRYLVISLVVLLAVLLIPVAMFALNGGLPQLAEGISNLTGGFAWSGGYIWTGGFAWSGGYIWTGGFAWSGGYIWTG